MEELLYRLDERTMRIEQRVQHQMTDIEEQVAENQEQINTLDNRVLKNTTKFQGLMAALGGIGTGLLAVAGKLFGLFKGI